MNTTRSDGQTETAFCHFFQAILSGLQLNLYKVLSYRAFFFPIDTRRTFCRLHNSSRETPQATLIVIWVDSYLNQDSLDCDTHVSHMGTESSGPRAGLLAYRNSSR